MPHPGRLRFIVFAGAALAATLHAEPTHRADVIDGAYFLDALLATQDLWNGGLDGTTGMGVYTGFWRESPYETPPRPREWVPFNGLFQARLTRTFTQASNFRFNPDMTLIAQARSLHNNAEAAFWAPPADRVRFATAATLGAAYTITHSPDLTHGGFFWGLDLDGLVPPPEYYRNVHGGNDPLSGLNERDKQDYGQVHTVYALASAYRITADPNHLAWALWGLDAINTHLGDPQPGDSPGRPSALKGTHNRDWSVMLRQRNLDVMCHFIETLLTLWLVLPPDHPRRADVGAQLVAVGEHVCLRLLQTDTSDPAGTRAFFPWFYTDTWAPAEGSNFASPGHAVEIAYLLSRTAEAAPGLTPAQEARWLDSAGRLMNFALTHAYDPDRGVLRGDQLTFTGARRDNTITWWPHAELGRALLHFAVVRDREDYWPLARKVLEVARERFTDTTYGGWYSNLDLNLNPTGSLDKGHIWKVNYHETNFRAEALRLLTLPARHVAEEFTPAELAAEPARTAPNGDWDGDGLPNLLEHACGLDVRTFSHLHLQPTLRRDGPGAPALQLEFAANTHARFSTLHVEWSDDLATWHRTGVTLTERDRTADRVLLQADVPWTAGTPFFLRLAADP